MATGLSSAEAAVCTPPAAARAEPSSASDPKWKKPCPARGKARARQLAEMPRRSRESGKGSLPVPVDAKQGDGKGKGGRGKGHKGGKGNPDAAEKRQQLSEENLKMIRGLGPKAPRAPATGWFHSKAAMMHYYGSSCRLHITEF